MNTWQRKALTIISVPLLAVPSAIGVYQFLEPTSGPFSAGMAAAGFELNKRLTHCNAIKRQLVI